MEVNQLVNSSLNVSMSISFILQFLRLLISSKSLNMSWYRYAVLIMYYHCIATLMVLGWMMTVAVAYLQVWSSLVLLALLFLWLRSCRSVDYMSCVISFSVNLSFDWSSRMVAWNSLVMVWNSELMVSWMFLSMVWWHSKWWLIRMAVSWCPHSLRHSFQFFVMVTWGFVMRSLQTGVHPWGMLLLLTRLPTVLMVTAVLQRAFIAGLRQFTNAFSLLLFRLVSFDRLHSGLNWIHSDWWLNAEAHGVIAFKLAHRVKIDSMSNRVYTHFFIKSLGIPWNSVWGYCFV